MDSTLQHFFMFAHDFRRLRANHRFKLKSESATLNSFNLCIIAAWNNLRKEIAEAENLNIFNKRLRRYLSS